MLLPLGTVTQSVQRELNPPIYPGEVARYHYIMDAIGSRASCRSNYSSRVQPAGQIFGLFVSCVRRARMPVPAADFEPAASRFSSERSYHLSYTGKSSGQ